MPYIHPEFRPPIDEHIDAAAAGRLTGPGALNYAITRLCLNYLDQRPRNYGALNAVMGALHCAALEFYRTEVAPYEDEVLAKNGPVTLSHGGTE